jgi:hypothetical protein
MEGLNFLLNNYSLLENPRTLKAYMDPKDEDGNSDIVTKQNNHRSLVLLIRNLIDNFSNNELKLLLERMDVSKYDKYSIYGGKAKVTDAYLFAMGKRSIYDTAVTSSEFFYLDEVDVLTYCFKKDNLEAYELFLEDGVLHTQYDGSRQVARGEEGTTVYTEIVTEIFYRVSGYYGDSNNNLELLEQFILLPLYHDKSEDFGESIHKGEPSIHDLIFLREILEEQLGGQFIPEELKALEIVEEMLKRSIETVERHNLMNAYQRMNTVKGLEDEGPENPADLYLDEDTRSILSRYIRKAIPYSQAEPFFDLDETLEQYLEKKEDSKKKLTKKKKRKKKGKKQKKGKKGKWGAAVKKGGAYKDLSPEDFEKWKNIHALSRDCGPCVLNLLGFNKEETKVLAGFYGSDIGMHIQEVINEFKRIYPDHTFVFLSSKKLNEELKTIREKIILVKRASTGIDKKKFKDDLRFFIKRYSNFIKIFYDDIFSDNENKAVFGRVLFFLGKLSDNNVDSHYIALSKYNGDYIMYDAQNKRIFIGLEDITLFLISQNVFQLEYLRGFKVDPEVVPQESLLNLNSPEESQRENDELLNELDGLVSKLDNSIKHSDNVSIRESRFFKLMDNPNTL